MKSQIFPLKSSECSETWGWRAHRQKRKTRGKGSHTSTCTAAYFSSFNLETQADNSDICSPCSCINIWGCSGMQYNPTKVKDREKNQINSIACLDNIVMEVLSQQLIWIPTANWVRTSDCIINSEREAKHFRKLPQNKVSELDASPFSTYSTKHILSIYPFSYPGIISEESYASSDWWLPSRR